MLETLTGSRGWQTASFVDQFVTIFTLVSGGVARLGHFDPHFRILLLFLIIIMVLVVVYKRGGKEVQISMGVLCGGVVAYLFYYIILLTFIREQIGFRLIMPIFPILLLFLVIGAEQIYEQTLILIHPHASWTRFFKIMVFVGLLIWAALLSKAVLWEIHHTREVWGNGWYDRSYTATRKSIHNSAVIQWLQENKLDGELLTDGTFPSELLFLYMNPSEPSQIYAGIKRRLEDIAWKKKFMLFCLIKLSLREERL